MDNNKNKLFILCDSREQSVSKAREIYHQEDHKDKKLTVILVRSTTVADELAGLGQQEGDKAYVVMRLIPKSEELTAWLDSGAATTDGVTFCSHHCPNFLKGKPVPFSENELTRRQDGAEEEKELRDWTQLRLMRAIIGRTELAAEIEELIKAESVKEKDEAALKNFQQRSNVDMAGGTYEGEESAGNPIDMVRRLISIYAWRDDNVLICGESGTGKETVAWTIHDLGNRSDKPFVVVNCAAFTETLLESELFGHKKGSFTDAKEDKKGIFEETEGGTIFLDELPEMSPAMQAKLLRCVEQKQIRRVGGSKDIKINVRIIAAGQPERLNNPKLLRPDLLYRLNRLDINLPSLNDLIRADKEIFWKIANNLLERETWSEESWTPAFIARKQKKLRDSSLAADLLNHCWQASNIRQLGQFLFKWLLLADDELLSKELTLTQTRPEKDPEAIMDDFVAAFPTPAHLPHAGQRNKTSGQGQPDRHINHYYITALLNKYQRKEISHIVSANTIRSYAREVDNKP